MKNLHEYSNPIETNRKVDALLARSGCQEEDYELEPQEEDFAEVIQKSLGEMPWVFGPYREADRETGNYLEAWTQAPATAQSAATPQDQQRTVESAITELESIEEFQIAKARLLEEMVEDEYEDFCKPTIKAYTAACEMVTLTAMELSSRFPHAIISADGDGGLNLEWRLPQGEVMLIIGAAGPRHIYHSLRGEYATEQASTPILIHWLKQLLAV